MNKTPHVAASGGYYVSCGADRILAGPATMTASIGVVGGKMVTNEMWDKLGISWDEVHSGDNASFTSRPPSQYGGLGANGAQYMGAEGVKGTLLQTGASGYNFKEGKVYNLENS